MSEEQCLITLETEFVEKVAVVLDCFEVFIEEPSNLLLSNYKHHNTIKLLIGIATPSVVSFISEAWGGRLSDKYLTEHCNILDKLLPGDVVLTNKGFDISDTVGMQQTNLCIQLGIEEDMNKCTCTYTYKENHLMCSSEVLHPPR